MKGERNKRWRFDSREFAAYALMLGTVSPAATPVASNCNLNVLPRPKSSDRINDLIDPVCIRGQDVDISTMIHARQSVGLALHSKPTLWRAWLQKS